MRSVNQFAPSIETLDDRALMSITLTNGLLEVVGTTGTDVIRGFLATPSTVRVTINTTHESQTFNWSEITGFLLRGRVGDDFLMVVPNIIAQVEMRGWTMCDTMRGSG